MYLAEPKIEFKAGVLVLHAWWGLTPFFKSFCDRLAVEGYLALAPDLYDGRTADTIAEAEKLRGQAKRETVIARVMEGWQALASHPAGGALKRGVIGFSLGAFWALWLAEQNPFGLTAVALFYGTRGGEYAQSQAAFLGHFAESDAYVAASGVKKLEKTLHAAGKQVAFYTYPGTGHWFFESNQSSAYQPEAANLAWERTLDFLQQRIEK
jgi:carboxymethylenebutenolidase